MFKQLLIVSILLVGPSLADLNGEPTAQQIEVEESGRELNKLHRSLFYAAADPLEVDQTLEQLKAAKKLIETEGDPEGLFAQRRYKPDLLIGLYSPVETCNPEQSHEISQLIDEHRAIHGIYSNLAEYFTIHGTYSNLVEYLRLARQYQLATCQLEEIQSRLGKTIGELSLETKLELPSVEKYVEQLELDQQERLMAFDSLPTEDVAVSVVDFLKKSGKGPKLLARVINDEHIKKVIDSTVSLLEDINKGYQKNLGLYSELSKDSHAWRKLGAGEKNKILVGRFCQVVANANDNLREQVNSRL